MDAPMKQRLVGAVVLVALGVIFLPMLVKGPAPDSGVADVSLDIPAQPRQADAMQSVDLPLETPAGAPVGGATGMPAPAAVPAAAAPSAAASGSGESGPGAAAGDYVVGFGSYASVADADKVIAALRSAELVAYREAATIAGNTVQRVRIGPFVDRAQAESARLTAVALNPKVEARVVALDAATPAPAAVAMPLPAAVTVAAAKAVPPTKPEPTKPEPTKPEPTKPEPTKPEPTKPEPTKPEPTKPEPTKPEPTKPEPTKPEAAKPAATKPAPAAGTGYAVQVGAFADAAAATSLRDKLRAAGFNAFTDTVQTEAGKRTRVRVGPAMTRAEADALKAQVMARAQIDGIVRPHP